MSFHRLVDASIRCSSRWLNSNHHLIGFSHASPCPRSSYVWTRWLRSHWDSRANTWLLCCPNILSGLGEIVLRMLQKRRKTKSRLPILKRGPLATSKWQNSLRASSDVHHALSYINKEALLVIKGCSHPTARLALLWAVSTPKPCPRWLNHFGTFQWRPGLTMSPRQCRTGGPQFTDETRLEPAAGTMFSLD